MSLIRTLVVDDEPLIADAHQAYLERVPGYTVEAVAHSGAEALRLLASRRVDLVLLDFYLPDMGGLDVCRAIRAAGHAADIIAVTSARDLATVRAAVSVGVVQYLLKPFAFTTFRDKLERYADYRRQLAATSEAVEQAEVDRALTVLRGSSAPVLPKGLSTSTLNAVIEHLRAAAEPVSASDIADVLGVARVTTRRYLEHLVDQGRADRNVRYGGAGRPEHLYAWRQRP
ncbi:MAG: response regulator [Micromonosporaceae bacterium]